MDRIVCRGRSVFQALVDQPARLEAAGTPGTEFYHAIPRHGKSRGTVSAPDEYQHRARRSRAGEDRPPNP